jgi:hypothetical protein
MIEDNLAMVAEVEGRLEPADRTTGGFYHRHDSALNNRRSFQSIGSGIQDQSHCSN